MNIYDFKVADNQGREVEMSQYKGKVLLIVNTATGCGFTPQYKELEQLYEKYRQQGFEVLDFPCNQFGHQAPGSDADINTFCTVRYNTSFPRFRKVDVNGGNASPLFTWLKKQKGGVLGNAIKWNFTKFLVDRQGNVVARYAPMTNPSKIEGAIEKLLG